ncbi:MAG: hypothetical protein A3K90_01825 [Pelodictyon luteolum]|uniref:DUF4199 domain-containing protein n=1 Tax=Pelodictyon luteolum TaxID=1100 RepID=A0A165L2J2_PELLU|nr:hypothetical protein [Pelodictyon luteolum]KZK73493.1 MAG: hypothetical protein A3K90_01825 [Pelodictyon luteolum]
MVFREKLFAVMLTASIVVLTTTVPYLTLVNVFLFAGIFIAGSVALNRSILRFQVRLPYNEAFILAFFGGAVGGILSEAVSWVLMETLSYRPGTESLSLVISWVLEMARDRPELNQQVQALLEAEKLALAPLTLSLTDILQSMLFSAAFYAPIAGFGGMWAVFRLKRKAARR